MVVKKTFQIVIILGKYLYTRIAFLKLFYPSVDKK